MRCKKRPLLVQKNCMRSHLDIKRCLPSISLSSISWLRSFSFSVGRKQIDDPNSDADAFNLLHLCMTDDSSCNEQCAWITHAINGSNAYWTLVTFDLPKCEILPSKNEIGNSRSPNWWQGKSMKLRQSANLRRRRRRRKKNSLFKWFRFDASWNDIFLLKFQMMRRLNRKEFLVFASILCSRRMCAWPA